jgi:putative phosphonate catabolism associated alcohol dehydrogenase
MRNTATFYAFDNVTRSFTSHSILIPDLNRGELLIKILYTTICRSDLNTFTGKRVEKNPTILGHEAVGIVEKICDENVITDLNGNLVQEGDRITWAIYASDPLDPLSLKGVPQKANNLFKYGHEKISDDNTLHGGLSSHIILRKNTPIVILPSFIPNTSAALINCAIATVAGAFRLSGSVENQIIVVNGAGMLGLAACAMAKSLKAAAIIAIDKDIKRLALSASFGSTMQWLYANEYGKYISVETGDEVNLKADCVFDFTGDPQAMASTLGLLGIGGSAIWVGATYPQPPVHINAEQVVRNLWTIRGLHNYNQDDLLHAVWFMRDFDHVFCFNSLVENKGSADFIHEAFRDAITSNHFRIGFEFNTHI